MIIPLNIIITELKPGDAVAFFPFAILVQP
jgi:hypothetical protein